MDIGLKIQLVNLCEFPFGKKWVLKYRASRDGFRSIDFHSKCDGIANTLTVIKAKTSNIFGGFTEQKWNSFFFSHFGNTYQHPVYVKDTDKAVNILAGLPEFKTLEIEVFVKQLETLTA